MSQYESLLIAYGTSPEEARFLAWDQERGWLANREHRNYGVYDPNPPSPEEVRQAVRTEVRLIACGLTEGTRPCAAGSAPNL